MAIRPPQRPDAKNLVRGPGHVSPTDRDTPLARADVRNLRRGKGHKSPSDTSGQVVRADAKDLVRGHDHFSPTGEKWRATDGPDAIPLVKGFKAKRGAIAPAPEGLPILAGIRPEPGSPAAKAAKAAREAGAGALPADARAKPDMPPLSGPTEALSSGRDHDELLAEMLERYDYGTKEWRKPREEAAKDARYLSGDPWEPDDRKAREEAGRPCLSVDELNQYTNQLINDVRQNKRAIKVDPEGSGANDETAELRADLIRTIEYRSRAQDAYMSLFENAVKRGYGFARVLTEYEEDRSFNQVLKVEPIPNPDLVTLDPDAQRPDGRDAKWVFIEEERTVEEFKRDFPKARVTSFSTYASDLPSWFSGDGKKLKLVEYWAIESTPRELWQVRLPNEPEPHVIFVDELPEGVTSDEVAPFVLQRRMVEQATVWRRLSNGVEILEETKWQGKYLPVVACYGLVMYLAGERLLQSLVRLARDGQMMLAYYRSTEAELVGQTPKAPFVGYEGQFGGREQEWQKAAHEPTAFLQVKATTPESGQQVLPLPQRPAYDPPIQALEVGAESARRGIMSAMGISALPTSAQRQNEKSGIALQRIKTSEQTGSYHFVDHFEASLEFIGIILNDLIPTVYDTARELSLRKADEGTRKVTVNDPQFQEQTDDGEPRGPHMIQPDARHVVTVSTGPSFDSERARASDFADMLAQNPQVFPLIAAEVVRLKNLGPIGDEMADALEVLKPPELRKQKQGQGPQVPPEVQQQMTQMQQQMEQMQQAGAELQRKLEAKTLEVESRERIAQMETQSRERIALAANETQLAVTEQKLDAQQSMALMEQQITRLQLLLDGHEAAQGRAHEVGLAQLQHAHGDQVSDVDRDHEMTLAADEREAAAQMPPPDASLVGEDAMAP